MNIHQCIEQGQTTEALELLLQHPDLVGVTDADGRTPLHLAAMHGHLDLAEALLAAGARPDVADKLQYTPRDYATQALTDAVIRPGMLRKLRKHYEWPGRAVQASLAWPRLCAWSTVFLSLLLVVAAVQPHWLGGLIGWNTVDAITDIRPGLDYSRGETIALAGTGDWIGLVKRDDTGVLMHQRSLVPQEFDAANVRDIGRCKEPGEFWLLAPHRIDRLRAGMFGPDIAPWLAQPSAPAWTFSPTLAGEEILANDLDDQGWTLVMRQGVATYELTPQQDGKPLRQRSWRFSNYPNLPISEAYLTKNRAWLVTENEKQRLCVVDRRTLTPVTEATLTAGPLKHFSVDSDETWAAAIDKDGRLYLFDGSKQRWQAPVLGRPASERPLRSLADVTQAKLENEIAWLVTRDGGFAYDQRRRSMRACTPQMEIDTIVPLATTTAGVRRALMTGPGGAVLIDDSNFDLSAKVIRKQPVVSADASIDGTAAGYVVANTAGKTQVEIITANVDDFAASRVLIPASGWTGAVKPPRITGMLPWKAELLMTSEGAGACLYDPRQHTYRDCSQVRMPGMSPSSVKKFRELQSAGGRPIAIADGVPVVCEPEGESFAWQPLWPESEAKFDQLSLCQEHVLAVSATGVLHVQKRSESTPARPATQWFQGQIDSLEALSLDEPPLGDLVVDKQGDFRFGLFHKSAVIEYDSRNASLKQFYLPASESPRQVRLTAGEPLLLQEDQTVSRGTQRVFGVGSFPFDPLKSTAIEVERSPLTSLLVGGPSGRVVRYNWKSGGVEALGRGLAWSSSGAAVERIYSSGGRRIVQSRDGVVAYETADGWQTISDMQSVAIDRQRQHFWLAGRHGVRAEPVVVDTSPMQWYCDSSGAGMRRFVETADFAWQDRFF